MNHKITSDLRYPQLWRQCEGAWTAGLGPTGSLLTDQAKQGRHGTMVSTMSASTGWDVSGGRWANKFDGTDDYFSMGDVSSYAFIQNTMVFSVVWWQKITSLTTRMAPLGSVLSSVDAGFYTICEYGAGAGTNAQSFVVAKAVPGTFVIAVRTPDNALTTAWQHIAVTGIGDALQMYINGIPQTLTVGSAFSGLSSGNSTRVLNLGRSNHSSHLLPFSGWIDDARVYNRTLAAGEVRLLATRRGIAYETAPRRRYKAAAAPPAGTANNLLLLGVG